MAGSHPRLQYTRCEFTVDESSSVPKIQNYVKTKTEEEGKKKKKENTIKTKANINDNDNNR